MKIIKPSRKVTEKVGKASSLTEGPVELDTERFGAKGKGDASSTDYEAKRKAANKTKPKAAKSGTGRGRYVNRGTRTSGADVLDSADASSDYKALMQKAIYLLSMREHSVQELAGKLNAKSDNSAAVPAVMEFLLENDYVSDIRFTESFVRFRANKGQGPIKIRSELRAKGVSTLLIDEHLDVDTAVWFDNAEALYNKKYGDEPVSGYNTWSKRARFLQSRGFTMDHIQSTVPQVDYE